MDFSHNEYNLANIERSGRPYTRDVTKLLFQASDQNIWVSNSKRTKQQADIPGGGGGGVDSHIKVTGVLVGFFLK